MGTFFESSIISPATYNQYMPSPAMSSMSRYSNTQILIGDAYKEQQYWLSTYNQAQQNGIKGVKLENIITQLLRSQEKLKGLQERILPAAEGYLKWENKVNEDVLNIFSGQGQG